MPAGAAGPCNDQSPPRRDRPSKFASRCAGVSPFPPCPARARAGISASISTSNGRDRQRRASVAPGRAAETSAPAPRTAGTGASGIVTTSGAFIGSAICTSATGVPPGGASATAHHLTIGCELPFQRLHVRPQPVAPYVGYGPACLRSVLRTSAVRLGCLLNRHYASVGRRSARNRTDWMVRRRPCGFRARTRRGPVRMPAGWPISDRLCHH